MEEPEEVTRELGVKLTGDEIQVIGRELGRKHRARALLDAERKRIAADYKSKLSKYDEDINRMSETLEKGEELRPVSCLKYFEGGTMRVKRLDTHVVIETRAATLQEAQRDLFGGKAGEGADTDAAPDPEAADDDEGDEDGVEDLDAAVEGRVRGDDGKTVGEFRQAHGGGVAFHTAGEERDPAPAPTELRVVRDDAPGLATVAEQQAAKKAARSKKGGAPKKPPAKKRR